MTVSGLLCVASLALAAPRFEDVTSGSGFSSVAGAALDAPFGSPVAWVHFDADEWPDLILGDTTGPTRLLRNVGGQLPFVDQTPPELAAITRVLSIDHFTVAPGPLAGDPRVPTRGLVFTTGGGKAGLIVVWFDGSGGVHTVPISRPAPRPGLVTHGDLDGDGAQDVVTTTVACAAAAVALSTVFRLERFPAGYRLSDEDPVLGPGCFPVPTVTDYRGTGHPSLMVATDFGSMDTPSYVYQAGQFEPMVGVYGMGVAIGDVNGDDTLDYVVTSAGPDLLWTSTGDRRQVETLGRGTEWGESAFKFKWGAAYADFDNDGDLELWMTAGAGGAFGLVEAEQSPRDVFLDDGVDIAAEAGIDAVTTKRGLALADYDRDGRLDALVTGFEARYLYHNVTTTEQHWVSFRMPDAPGARVWVTGCGKTRTREWSGGNAGVASEPLVHVGLGVCAGPVEVAVRWPWLGRREYGAFEVDRHHTLPDPGTVWVEPAVVRPGEALTVHSTLSGVVSVNDHPIVGGTATLAADNAAGMHRLRVTVDGAAIDLVPKYRVANTTVDVITDPWPPRQGHAARLGSTSVEGAVSVEKGGTIAPDGLVAAAGEVTLRVGNSSVSISAIPLVAAKTVLETERLGDAVNARVALIDDIGAVSFVPGASVSVSMGDAPTTLTQLWQPWRVATGGPEVETVRVHVDGALVKETLGVGQIAGSVDLGRSHVWTTTPIVRADGQDIIQVALVLRDSSGRLIAPDATWFPTAPGCVALDTVYTPLSNFGATVWTARLRVGSAVGPVSVTAGALTTIVWVLPPEPAAVTTTTTLERTATGYELIPRDASSQRLGSGIGTDPTFEYAGSGRYVRVDGADSLTVVVGGQIQVTYADGVSRAEVWTPAEPGCTAGGRATGNGWPLGLLVGVLAVSALTARRRRLAEKDGHQSLMRLSFRR